MKIRLFTIPNFITLSNLLCGVGSIVASLQYHNLMLAFALVILAAVFDFFDGFAARLLHCSSPIGVQLDSLADMVSFGTAPAFALYTLIEMSSPAFGLCPACASCVKYIPFLMTAFSALRLAKFNIDDTQHEEFSGLTTTANGIFCTSAAASIIYAGVSVPAEWIAIVSLIMACLLISPIRMFSFKVKGLGWSENKVRYIFIVIALVTIALLQLYSIPVIIVLYVITSTIRWIVIKNR